MKNNDLPLKVLLNTEPNRARVHKHILGQSIVERPVEIDDRKEFGHLEVDTVLGTTNRGNVLLTITGRKTRKEIPLKIST